MRTSLQADPSPRARAGASDGETREPPKDFDRLREAFQHRFEGLSPHLKRIAQHALGNPNRFALQTVAETARETGVQPSTLIRFAKVFGFSGFSEMQQVFRLRLIEGAPSFRDQIHEHRGKLEEAAEDDPSAILHGFADASAVALDHLKADIDGDALRAAVRMMDGAKAIYVIGQRRAFPVAAYLAYGLIRLEYRCHLLDSVGGMLPQQVATIGADDLFVAVELRPVRAAGGGRGLRRPHPQRARCSPSPTPWRVRSPATRACTSRCATPTCTASGPWRRRSCWRSR